MPMHSRHIMESLLRKYISNLTMSAYVSSPERPGVSLHIKPTCQRRYIG